MPHRIEGGTTDANNDVDLVIATAPNSDGDEAVRGEQRSDNGDRDSELRAHVIETHSMSINVTIERGDHTT